MRLRRRPRQWDIYRANLGEGPDCFLLILSSEETNEILESQVIGCELVPERVQKLTASPVTLKAVPEATGLQETVTISVATVASIPRNCLVDLEGRLDPMSHRLAVTKTLHILFGDERWP